MKILHIGNLKSGIDTYVRNTVALVNGDFEFVIVNGADDNSCDTGEKSQQRECGAYHNGRFAAHSLFFHIYSPFCFF